MDFPATVKSGRLHVLPAVANHRDTFLGRMKDGTPLIVSIKRVGRKKTNQQVRCHWGLVVGTIYQEFLDRGMDLATLLNSPLIPPGLEVPVNVIQDFLYACCNGVGDNGERKTLSKMDTVEASRFFENCRKIAAGWDIQLPDPDPLYKMRGQDGPDLHNP